MLNMVFRSKTFWVMIFIIVIMLMLASFFGFIDISQLMSNNVGESMSPPPCDNFNF